MFRQYSFWEIIDLCICANTKDYGNPAMNCIQATWKINFALKLDDFMIEDAFLFMLYKNGSSEKVQPELMLKTFGLYI